MSPISRTFRIFVSSTFNDLKAERNALQQEVFPRLRSLCENKGAHFQAIDLRWGVTEEATLDQKAMHICLSEIERCQQVSPRPNFIILLGNRYGWRPLPYEIPADEYDRIYPLVPAAERALVTAWYRRDENSVPAVYILQPRMSELGSIPVTEFERMVAYPDMQPDVRETLGRWYELGQAKEPVIPRYFTEISSSQKVYILKAFSSQDKDKKGNERFRAARILENFFWGEIEPHLHEVLYTAARDAIHAEAVLVKYYTSATEQEILHGAIQVVDTREHIFCFTRETEAIPAENEHAREFIDLTAGKPDEKAKALLSDLKTRLKDVLGGNYHEYPVHWAKSGPTRDHIDRFSKDVYDALSKVILSEIEHPREALATAKASTHIQPDPALDVEGLAHHKFAEERLRFFVGRTEMLAKISDHLRENGHRILGFVGGGGTGKSALMAKAVEQTRAGYPGAEVVYRFIGATPGSSDGRSLLDSLCHEISRRYGADTAAIPTDYRDLVPELGKRMALATAEKPLTLFLDSLDQLSTSQSARSLIWLPTELPEHVSVVVSTRDEDTWKNLQSKSPHLEILAGLSPKEGDELLSQWLADIHRSLQPPQRDEVMKKFEASQGNPLYLKLAFEEADLWTSYQPQEQLAIGVSDIIKQNMIDRMKHESNHGEALVSHALGYLAASRYGLAEDELVDLLSRDPQVYNWFYRKSYHLPTDLIQAAVRYCKASPPGSEEEQAAAWLNEIRDHPDQVADFLGDVLSQADGPRLPVVLWSRLSFDLAPYLSERMVDGSTLLNFYHRELGEASKDVFLSDGKEKPYHEKLADYFRFKADPAGDQTWTGQSKHGLSELPYHLTRAERHDDIFQILTDFKFLEHKVVEVGVQVRTDEQGRPTNTYTGVLQLQEDYELALAALPGGEGGAGDRAPLILTALETSQGLMVYCPVCNKASPIQKDMLDKRIACPQKTCQAPIKLNPFTVKREI